MEQTSGQPWIPSGPTLFTPHPLLQPFLCRQEGLVFCTSGVGVGGEVGEVATQPCLPPL